MKKIMALIMILGILMATSITVFADDPPVTSPAHHIIIVIDRDDPPVT